MKLNIPQTPADKIKVLTEARELLTTNFTQGSWVMMIDGVENYCLYGAVEKCMGADFRQIAMDDASDYVLNCDYGDLDVQEIALEYLIGDRDFQPDLDRQVSSCSLTTTMYEAAVKAMPDYMTEARRFIDRHPDTDSVMGLRVNHLQAINDVRGQEAVLKVLDQAIEDLQAQVDAS